MRRFWLKLKSRRRIDEELEEELAFHRAMAAERGNPIPLGKPLAIREQSLDLWRFQWLEDFWQDLRYGWRERMHRRLAVTAPAVLSLALGIGASVAIFCYLDGLYLRPLPVAEPERLAHVFADTDRQIRGTLSYPEFGELARLPSFSGAAAAQGRGARLLANGEDQLVSIYCVSENFFQLLGVRAQLGRVFGSGDRDGPGVVLGHSAWLRLFGGDPSIAGKSLRLSRGIAGNVTVLGVLPAEFRDLTGSGDRDLWMPPETFEAISGGAREEFEDRYNTSYYVLARLRPEATVRQAQAEAEALHRRLAGDYPATNTRRRFTVLSDFDYRMENAGTTGLVLFGIVLMVMAIACVNVSNLLLGAVESRQRELAVRAAIGAGPWRIARQLFAESVLLGGLAAIAGAGVAYLLVALIPAVIDLPEQTRALQLFRVDARAAVFAFSVLVLTILLFGIAPAWIGSGANLTGRLKGAGAGPGRLPVRDRLALLQVAVSLALLTAASLLMASFLETRSGDIGLARKNVLNAWLSRQQVPAERPMLERLQALPGVREVSLAFRAPLSGSGGGLSMPVHLPGHGEFGAGQPPVAIKYNSVGQRYFGMMGVRLLRGRLFEDSDDERGAKVAVISEAMSRRFWPNDDPVGKRIAAAEGAAWVIVGVVSDAPINSVGEIPEPYFYTVWWQNPMGEFTLLLETEGAPARLIPLVRAALRQMDSKLEQAQFSTMEELIAARGSRYRRAAQLVSGLGVLGIILTAIGLYGVIARNAALRRREIGIRMALGAGGGETARMIAMRALQLTAAGIALGLPLAMLTAHAMRSMLFGVGEWHPPSFFAAALLLLIVAIGAAWLPAVRAAHVDPVLAMKVE
ncbi:MAG: ABC transporter permease [Bryobacterales bacterium]|nr:ABC transporter permease [Bryobacterales bacterium]